MSSLLILSVIAITLLLVLLIFYSTKSSKNTTNSSESKSESKRKPSPPNPNKPSPPNPNKPYCFVPKEQQFNCNRITGDDPLVDEFKCIPWIFPKMNKGAQGSACAELDLNIQEGDECSNESQDVYNRFCNSGNDPVIRDHNRDYNNNPCPGDCNSNIENCYTDFLIRNQCQFRTKHNSGDYTENCINTGNNNGLLCGPELRNACSNIFKRNVPIDPNCI